MGWIRIARVAIVAAKATVIAFIGSISSLAGQPASNSWTFQPLHFFTAGPVGYDPASGLTMAGDGNFYGATLGGGTFGSGTIYRLNGAGGVSIIHSFNGQGEGRNPQATLLKAKDGSLYGTTFFGGPSDGGTIFKIDTNGVLINLYSFSGGNDGAYPSGLVQADDAHFYGTTAGYIGNGLGAISAFSENGTVFCLAPNGVLTTLHVFSGKSDGGSPRVGLIKGNDGKLYGTTFSGGESYRGTIYNVTTGGEFSTLYSFTGDSDGKGPLGLILGKDGKLYGIAETGGDQNAGTIFSMDAQANVSLLYSFDGDTGGSQPTGSLIELGNGDFYGVTQRGGANRQGTVFQISSAGVFNSLYSFTGKSDGAGPVSGLAVGADGLLYGTTAYGFQLGVAIVFAGGGGGSGTLRGSGTVFRITTNGTFGTLASFPLAVDGGWPTALAQGSDGALYGLTEIDGKYGYGTAFRITPDGSLTVLHDFNGFDGGYSTEGFVFGKDGYLYATTGYGGSRGGGTIFRMSTNGNLTTMYNFTGVDDGLYPSSALIVGEDGSMYGTTAWATKDDHNGTIFRMTMAGILETVYRFTGVRDSGESDGGRADGPLIRTSDGSLYGVTQFGGAGQSGTVFRITSDNTFVTVYSFTGQEDGGQPKDGLIKGSDGNLYGVTSEPGTAFRLTPDGTLTTLHRFRDYETEGINPISVSQAADGNLYGVTGFGGKRTYGTFFKLTPEGNMSIIQDLNNASYGRGAIMKLIRGVDGNIYASCNGGPLGLGSIFGFVAGGRAPAITRQPISGWLSAGANALLTAEVAGSLNSSVQWRLNGTNILGKIGPSLPLTDFGPLQAGNYTFVASNSYGSVTSAIAQVSFLGVKAFQGATGPRSR